MHTNQTGIRWQGHPIALATGVLLLVFALMVTQKYLRFGGSPNFDLLRSLTYNLITIVPFSLCLASVVIVRELTSSWSWRLRALAIAILGFVLVAIYVITISAILYSLGMSASWPSNAFLIKYISGPLHVHAALFALIQFVPMPSRVPPQTQKVPEYARVVFGIPIHEILAIEADDHYVWIRTRSGSVLKRSTIRDLASRLPDQFLRVHRSHIVNLDQIDGTKRAGRTMQLLVGDNLVPVSASRRALVSQHLDSRTI